MSTHTMSQKFPWINTGTKTVLFLLKNRIKAPRVVPAPSTGDPATDDATRREFERVKEQLAADYQDQRNALKDLEPLIYELAEQVQGWMSEKESRLAEREERMMNMLLMARGQMPGMSGMPGMPTLPGMSGMPTLPAASSSSASSPEQAAAAALGQAYEGQIIKGDASNPVYKVEGGRKRWILSPEIFNRMGFNWNSIVTLPQATVDKISFGANIT